MTQQQTTPDPDSLRAYGLLLPDSRFLDYRTTDTPHGVPVDVWQSRASDALTVQVVRQRAYGFACTVFMDVSYPDRRPSLFDVAMVCRWFFRPGHTLVLRELPDTPHTFRISDDPHGTPYERFVRDLFYARDPRVARTA